MLPRDLIATARDLVKTGAGKPRHSNLCRATSTTYYAVFHTLARSCADLMVGGAGAARSAQAWQQVYRALEHGFAKNACTNAKVLAQFPQGIQDFANMFVQMQSKRHSADYDPFHVVYKSEVLNDIQAAEAAIADFVTVAKKDRRAFAAWVLFKPPRN